jgi:hypothetical protein
MHPLLSRWISRRPSLPVPSLPVAATQPFSMTSMVRVPATSARRLRMRVDPSDQQRTLISGRMSDVCDALDALVLRQQA